MHLLEIIQYLFILYLLVIQYHSSLFLEIKVLSLEGNNLFFFFYSLVTTDRSTLVTGIVYDQL